MEELSQREQYLVQQLRRQITATHELTSTQKSDFYFAQWIRAKNGNLEAAAKMMREALKWREENKIDSLLSKAFPRKMHELAPYYIAGRDKSGRPICSILLGSWDMRKILSAYSESVFVQYTNQTLERMFHYQIHLENQRSQGKAVKPGSGQFLFLVDMTGYSTSQALYLKGVQNLVALFTRSETYYPGILGQTIIVNAPSSFSMFYTLLKKAMSPQTQAKTSVYGTKGDWRPLLKRLVEEDQLGTQFGGTKVLKL